jgi:hypothetical protein
VLWLLRANRLEDVQVRVTLRHEPRHHRHRQRFKRQKGTRWRGATPPVASTVRSWLPRTQAGLHESFSDIALQIGRACRHELEGRAGHAKE